MNSVKNVVISGYYGFENFGDEAILKVLTSKLKDCGVNVTVFSKNPEYTKEKLDVNAVYSFCIKSVFTAIKKSDILVSGGGSLLQDVTSVKSLFYYLFVIFLAVFFKKDVIIFAQGIGPIRNKFGQFVTKKMLKHCKYISVRDEKSKQTLLNWGLCPELVSDPVWNLNVGERVIGNKIGVQLRSWETLSDKYLSNLANELVEKFSDKEICIYSFQDVLDYEICEKFEKMLRAKNSNIQTRILNNLSIDETIQSFSTLDCLIAMRYHACLLALKYGVPTLALSYDEKVEKLAKRFELPYSLLDEKENFDSLINQMMNLSSIDLIAKTTECKFDFQNIIKIINS